MAPRDVPSNTPPESPPTGTQIAMPLFASLAAPEPAQVVEAWASLFPAAAKLRVADEHGAVITYETDGRALATVHLPRPIPGDEATAALVTSWMWQKPDAEVRAHAAHAIVTALGAGDPLRAAWDVARLSAAMLRAGTGTALYWGASLQVHPPELVASFSAEPRPPVALWVGITISGVSQAGPFSAATHGLAAFGQKELEVLGTRRPIGDLRLSLLQVASFLLARGPVLLDGQTFGPSADVKWSVRHRPSQLVAGREVIVLEIP